MPAAAIQDIDTDQLIAADKASRISTDDLIKAHQQEIKTQRVKNTELESGLYGAAQGVTMGFADEGYGAVKAGVDAAKGKVKDLGSLVDTYRKYRDQARQKFDQARNDNPISYTTGEVAGGVGTALIPGVNVAKGASVGAKMLNAAAQGAVMGAGTSNADLTKGQTDEFKGDVLQGAAIGGATQGALSGLGTVAEGIANRFKNIPEERAVKAVTGQNISALRQMTGTTLKSSGDIEQATQQIKKIGRDILDEPGVLSPLSKVEDMAPKLAGAREKYGKLIGEVGKQIDSIAPNAVNTQNIADDIVKYAETIPETLQGLKLKDRLLDEAANFEKMKGLSFEDAQKFKNQFKYKPVDADALVSNQDVTNKVRGIISTEMEKTVDKLSNAKDGVINLFKTGSTATPQEQALVQQGAQFNTDKFEPLKDLLDKYKLFKSKYGSFKAASDAATDRVQKNLTNRFVSPSDYGIGSTAAVLQGLAGGGPSATTIAVGAGAAAANKFMRERGSALAAKTADTLIKTFESEGVQKFVKAAQPLVNLAKKGNPAAILTFQVLSKQNPQAFQALDLKE